MTASAPLTDHAPTPTQTDLPRRAAAEAIGGAALAAIVIGSGVMATRLSGDVGVQLIINALATVFGLAALITALGPVSGAHLNPAVTLVMLALRRVGPREAIVYVAAQSVGCLGGAVLANLMFALPAVSISTTARAEPAMLLGEVVATAGLVAVILLMQRHGRDALIAPAVAAHIGAAYFFTSSTSFANPAITIGRMASDTFAGIAPASVAPYIAAQLIGAALGLAAAAALAPRRRDGDTTRRLLRHRVHRASMVG